MTYHQKKVSFIALWLMLPCTLCANIVWPALYTESKVSSVPIILLSLIIEFFFFKWLFKLNVRKAVYYTVVANTVSGIFGLFLRPLSGIVWEVSLGMAMMWLFDWGTFNPVTWFSVPILGGVVNAFLELLTIRIVWKQKINKRNYFLTWGINLITVAIATVWVVLYPPAM